jgi:hypothetical protein
MIYFSRGVVSRFMNAPQLDLCWFILVIPTTCTASVIECDILVRGRITLVVILASVALSMTFEPGIIERGRSPAVSWTAYANCRR